MDDASHKPILTATRTSSTWNATTTVCGSTTIGRNRTTPGIRTTSGVSVSETIFFSATSYVAVFLFRVFKVLFPAVEHFADLLQFKRYILAVLIRYEPAFPCDGYEKLKRIEAQNAFIDFWNFLLFFSKIGCIG